MIHTAHQCEKSRKTFRSYQAYGLSLKSHLPLSYSPRAEQGLPKVEFLSSSKEFSSRSLQDVRTKLVEKEWFFHKRLKDGTDYLCWRGLCEFLITADGKQIVYHARKGVPAEILQNYLVSQALSFSLLKFGIEPLHATAVMMHGQAIGLLGNCGDGKSSLGAAFLQAGHRILTDDLLVIKNDESGKGFYAFPGPPRIKLYPNISKQLLGRQARGIPMNPRTKKQIIPLTAFQHTENPTPLRALYILRQPPTGSSTKRIALRRLSVGRAMLYLISNTFNHMVVTPDRLARQFNHASQIAKSLPILSITYPRTINRLPEVLDAIRSDLQLYDQ